MLLNEIVREPLKVKPQGTKRFDPDYHSDRFNMIGHGIGAGLDLSGVYEDKKHPNRVVKVVRIRDTNDTYLKFIRMIEKHQNNPFFPRIYNYKIYQEDDHFVLYVFMEKLMPLRDFHEGMIKNILNTVGIPYYKEWRLVKDMSLRDVMNDEDIRADIRNSTPNPKLKEALRLLEPMFKRFRNDMHVGNLMARLTSVGPQIVIVDPIFPSLEQPKPDDIPLEPTSRPLGQSEYDNVT